MALNLMSAGLGEGVSEEQSRAAWATFDAANPAASLSLSDSMRSLVSKLDDSAYSPDGRFMLARSEERNGGYYESGSDVFNWTTTPTYRLYDTTQGAGEAIKVFDAEGHYLRSDAGAGIIGQLKGVLLVASAAAGFAAVGASTGAGAAVASETAATTVAAPVAEGGSTFLGTGTATGGVGYGFGGSTYGGAAIGQGLAETLATGAGIVAGDPLTYAKGAVSLASTIKSAAGLFGGSGGGSARNGSGSLVLPAAGASSPSLAILPIGSAGGDRAGGPAAAAERADASGSGSPFPWWIVVAIAAAGVVASRYMKGSK